MSIVNINNSLSDFIFECLERIHHFALSDAFPENIGRVEKWNIVPLKDSSIPFSLLNNVLLRLVLNISPNIWLDQGMRADKILTHEATAFIWKSSIFLKICKIPTALWSTIYFLDN